MANSVVFGPFPQISHGQFCLSSAGFNMLRLAELAKKASTDVSIGGDYMELTAEVERRLISSEPKRIVPDLVGDHAHFQLLDLFALSSIGTFQLYLKR